MRGAQFADLVVECCKCRRLSTRSTAPTVRCLHVRHSHNGHGMPQDAASGSQQQFRSRAAEVTHASTVCKLCLETKKKVDSAVADDPDGSQV